jgi:SsrA-binding protein
VSSKDSDKKKDSIKPIVSNRRARFEFEILQKFEAGLALQGTEVKALREGDANLTDSYVRVLGDEAFLLNAYIGEYKMGSWTNHEPKRKRKLLLHRQEIHRLESSVGEKGLTIIPLSIYFKNGLAKVEIATAKGKKLYDKRESMKKRDAERDIRRSMSGRG